MRYFKHQGDYVEADRSPFTIDPHAPFVISGVQVDIPSDFLDTYTGFVPVDQLIYWEEIHQEEYLAHLSLQNDLLSTASRDDQASLWAMNTSSHMSLLYGGVYPEDDGDLGDIHLAVRKYEMIRKTQHRIDPTIPNPKRGNVSITRWITIRRRTSPFIYIGE